MRRQIVKGRDSVSEEVPTDKVASERCGVNLWRWTLWGGTISAVAMMGLCLWLSSLLGQQPYWPKGGTAMLTFARVAVPVAGLVGYSVGYRWGVRRR